MDAPEVFGPLRQELNRIVQMGHQFVHIPSLLEWLRAIEVNAPAATQTRDLQHQSALAHYRAVHESSLEMFRSVMETGKTALTTTILVNGGATAALLTFISTVYKQQPGLSPAKALVVALIAFAVGVLLGAVATGTTYVCQFCYEREFRRTGIGFHILTVGLVFLSYATFAIGVIAAFHAFT